jgi:Fe-S oxidoreductase
MVTREEEHSTRGRANALRAALSGRLPLAELTSRRMYEVMDLCVECKACKAECPSSVDMAKIKLEFLARYHEAHGVPLRGRLFAAAARRGRLWSGPLAPLANAVLGSGWVRAGMEKALGIARERPLPPFAREPFPAWFARHGASCAQDRGAAGTRGRVVLFDDTFTRYHEPGVGIAAVGVLEAAGFEVVLAGHRCCGRPAISKGLVGQAREAARQTVERLAPLAEAGLPIVGLEPSCLLTLRDEYLDLLPGDARAKLIAEHAVTFEEFLAGPAEEGRLELPFTGGPRRVLLHGHCHQKALVGTEPARRVLALPPGTAVEEVDSGCCGMAGSFGYEVEHYAISRAMAERRLLPAVREAAPTTVLAAAGTSCRAQILHGTGRRARHPAEVLWEALDGPGRG